MKESVFVNETLELTKVQAVRELENRGPDNPGSLDDLRRRLSRSPKILTWLR